MKAKYKIDINYRDCYHPYILYKRWFRFFWRRVDTSSSIEELEEKIKATMILPKYYE